MTSYVFRRPWVGQNYQPGGLLLLGESHYGTADEQNDALFTETLIRDYANRQWRHRYYTMIGSILTGRPGPDVDPFELWHSVAFHNYVPAFMPCVGVAPSGAQWIAGGEPFQAVLRDLSPGRVLVLGKRLWWAIETYSGIKVERTRPMKFDWGEWEVARLLAGSSSPICASWIRHPSRAKCSDWHEVCANFLGGAWEGARVFNA